MKKAIASLAFAGTILVAAGCGDSSGPGNSVLTAAAAQGVGDGLVQTTNALAASFTGTGATSILLAPATSAVTGLAAAAPGRATPFLGSPPACAVVTGNTSDPDTDGIPTDATYTFTAGNCTNPIPGGYETTTGSIRVQDPGAGFTVTYTGLKFAYTDSTNASQNFSITLNGGQSLAVSGPDAVLSHMMTLAFRFGTQTASYSENWSVTYTPASGSYAAGVSPLPSGTFDISGSVAFSGGGKSFSFSINTPTPLSYDATCAGVTDPPFTAGDLRAVLTGTGGSTYIQAVYGPACGNVVVNAFGTTA